MLVNILARPKQRTTWEFVNTHADTTASICTGVRRTPYRVAISKRPFDLIHEGGEEGSSRHVVTTDQAHHG